MTYKESIWICNVALLKRKMPTRFQKCWFISSKHWKKSAIFFFKLTKNIVKTRIKIAFMKESFLHTSWIYVTKLKHKDWYSIMENLSHSNIRNTTTIAKKTHQKLISILFTSICNPSGNILIYQRTVWASLLLLFHFLIIVYTVCPINLVWVLYAAF